eukprot:8702736-Pyramimonas_sp.AAC.1
MIRLGIPVSYKLAATDLGIDVSAGRRRIKKKANQRLAAARRRHGRVLRLRRLGPRVRRVCSSLWTTGVLPQGCYGHQVLGTAPSTMLEVRRQAAAAIA